jgi:hypothetical protein
VNGRLAVAIEVLDLSKNRPRKLIIYVVGACFLGFSLIFSPALGVGCALAGLAGGLILAYTPSEDWRFVGLVLLVSIGLKIAVATLYQSYLFSGGLPIFAPDGEGFSKFGWYISRVLLGKDPSIIPSAEHTYWNYHILIKQALHGVLPPIGYQTGVYTYFLGLLYVLFGYSPLLGRLINVLLSAVSAFLVMRVAADQAGRRGARLAFFLVLFWPSMFLFSLSLLRDTVVVFLIVTVVWSVHRFVKGTPLALAGILGGIGLIILLRWQVAWLLVAIVVLWYLIRFLQSKKALLVVPAVGVLLLGFGRGDILLKKTIAKAVIQHVGYIASSGVNYSILPSHMNYSVEKWPRILEINPSVENKITIDIYNATESEMMQLERYLTNLSWAEILGMYFRGVVHYLTEPWPSHLRTLKLKIFAPQMFLWYACLALAGPGLLAYWRQGRDMCLFIMLFLAIFISLYGLSEGTIGVLIRHRDMISPFVLLLSVVGLEAMFRKKVTF